MAAGEGRRAVTPGPVGQAVSQNLARLRTRAGLTTRQLSAALAQTGRSVPASGITRMEKGERRVDVDELVALAIALGVSPSLLLLPMEPPQGTPDDPDRVQLSPARAAPWATAWQWMHGQAPLGAANAWTARRFRLDNRPYEED